MSIITVYKHDANGREVLSYTGEVVERTETSVYLRAPFNIESADLGLVVLRRGDVFHEWFYTDRWYNVFRIEDRDSGALKGWYCNITRPAVLTEDEVRSDDLALDVFIMPDGEIHEMDLDEYEALQLVAAEREHVAKAVDEIIIRYRSGQPPFGDG